MRKWGLGVAAVVGALAVAAGATNAAPSPSGGIVQRVADGDTLTLRTGERVRLVQIDAPELSGNECYGREAAAELRRLANGKRVNLAADPALDNVDRYGRLLRYVSAGGRNLNLELVRRGAATPYFFDGDRGRLATSLLRAAQSARAAKRGLWKACPGTALDPLKPATTLRTAVAAPAPAPGPPATTAPPATPTTPAVTTTAPTRSGCDPSYPTVCIPPPPPDLDCGEISFRNFKVLPPDPHRFDGNDKDGIGCES